MPPPPAGLPPPAPPPSPSSSIQLTDKITHFPLAANTKIQKTSQYRRHGYRPKKGSDIDTDTRTDKDTDTDDAGTTREGRGARKGETQRDNPGQNTQIWSSPTITYTHTHTHTHTHAHTSKQHT